MGNVLEVDNQKEEKKTEFGKHLAVSSTEDMNLPAGKT